MISPTRQQVKDWYKIVSGYPCMITGRHDIELHHPAGRSYKKDKVQVGELFVYPLWWELHRNPNHPFSVTDHRKAFVKEYGREVDIFMAFVEKVKAAGYEIPFDELFLEVIGRVDR